VIAFDSWPTSGAKTVDGMPREIIRDAKTCRTRRVRSRTSASSGDAGFAGVAHIRYGSRTRKPIEVIMLGEADRTSIGEWS
jgi:hypothetical protein